MPRVSVILNAFDQVDYVAEAVDSVLGQTMQDFELIAIDNGSTDGTRAVLERYEPNPKVRLLLHEENRSITTRFNEGVSVASGDLVCFLYSDDYYLRHKLARQVRAFDELDERYGVVYGPGSGRNELTGERWVQPCIEVANPPLHDLLTRWLEGQIDMISPMFRRVCLETHPFHEEIFAEGEAVLFRVALTHWFHFIDEPLAVNRDTGRNAGKALRRNCEITFAALDKLAADPRFPSTERSTLDGFRRSLLQSYGWQTARLDTDRAWGRECLRRAAAGQPSRWLLPRAIGAYALLAAPPGVRRAANRLGFRLGNRHGNDVAVDDFGGSVGSSHTSP